MPSLLLRLLLAVVLLAAGIGSVCYTGSHVGAGLPRSAVVSIYFSAFALIGAGLFLPFNRPLLGAFLGMVAAVVIVIVIQSSREQAPAPQPAAKPALASPLPGPILA